MASVEELFGNRVQGGIPAGSPAETALRARMASSGQLPPPQGIPPSTPQGGPIPQRGPGAPPIDPQAIMGVIKALLGGNSGITPPGVPPGTPPGAGVPGAIPGGAPPFRSPIRPGMQMAGMPGMAPGQAPGGKVPGAIPQGVPPGPPQGGSQIPASGYSKEGIPQGPDVGSPPGAGFDPDMGSTPATGFHAATLAAIPQVTYDPGPSGSASAGEPPVIEAQVKKQADDTSAFEKAQKSYPGGKASYTVKQGDTLTSIAKQLGTTVDAIASANGIRNANRIQAGRTLIAPSVVGGAGMGRTKKKSGLAPTAKKGDSGPPKPRQRPAPFARKGKPSWE